MNSKNFLEMEQKVFEWMGKHGHTMLRIAFGVVYIWFGALKPLGVSPAAALVEKTVFWMPPRIFIPLLGCWEMVIGLCFLIPSLTRIGVGLLCLHMPGTFLPFIVLPEVCFQKFPFILTLEGQYIVKNLYIIAAGMVLGGTLKKG